MTGEGTRDAGVAHGASGDEDFRMMELRATTAVKYRRVTPGAALAGIVAALGAVDRPAGFPGQRSENDEGPEKNRKNTGERDAQRRAAGGRPDRVEAAQGAAP